MIHVQPPLRSYPSSLQNSSLFKLITTTCHAITQTLSPLHSSLNWLLIYSLLVVITLLFESFTRSDERCIYGRKTIILINVSIIVHAYSIPQHLKMISVKLESSALLDLLDIPAIDSDSVSIGHISEPNSLLYRILNVI